MTSRISPRTPAALGLWVLLAASSALADEPPPSAATAGAAPEAVAKADAAPPAPLKPLVLGETALKLGGYVQPGAAIIADTEFNALDDDGFMFANARLTGSGRFEVSSILDLGYMFNFDVNSGNFSVRDVYGTFSLADDLVAFDIGQMKMPFSLALLQSEAELQMPFSPGATLNGLFAPGVRVMSFGRDLGVKVRGEAELGSTWLGWAAAVGNGEGGFRQRRNIDDEFIYVGRVEFGPFGEMRRSEPDLWKSDFKLVIGAAIGHAPELGRGLGLQDVGAEETRFEADLRLHFQGFSLKSEVLLAWRGDTDTSPGFGRYGAYVQAGYVLPLDLGTQFEIVARWHQVDYNDADTGFDLQTGDVVQDNTEIRMIDIGANAYFYGHSAKVMLAYRLTDFLEGPRTDTNGDVLIGDALFVFAQFGWL